MPSVFFWKCSGLWAAYGDIRIELAENEGGGVLCTGIHASSGETVGHGRVNSILQTLETSLTAGAVGTDQLPTWISEAAIVSVAAVAEPRVAGRAVGRGSCGEVGTRRNYGLLQGIVASVGEFWVEFAEDVGGGVLGTLTLAHGGVVLGHCVFNLSLQGGESRRARRAIGQRRAQYEFSDGDPLSLVPVAKLALLVVGNRAQAWAGSARNHNFAPVGMLGIERTQNMGRGVLRTGVLAPSGVSFGHGQMDPGLQVGECSGAGLAIRQRVAGGRAEALGPMAPGTVRLVARQPRCLAGRRGNLSL